MRLVMRTLLAALLAADVVSAQPSPPQNSTLACTKPSPSTIHSPKKNVWYGLSSRETYEVTQWLLQQPELNLTAADNATEWSNTINYMHLLLPNKTDVLAYIDANGTAPPRFAQVGMNLRASDNATWTEIFVGPLPVNGSNVEWQYLAYPHSLERGASIRNLAADSLKVEEFKYAVGKNISDITSALWNATARDQNDALTIYGVDPPQQLDGRIIRWDTFWHKPQASVFDATSLLPQGLFFKSDTTGRDPSQWSVQGFLYNDIFYPTEDEFRAAFHTPGFERLPPSINGEWTSTDQQGPRPPLDEVYPPTNPAGLRYSVDHEQNYIRWMDWSFYTRIDNALGLSLFDIRFKDQRILYELAFQEAIAHYAGDDPVISGIAFLDSYYGFVYNARSLVPGYDCPQSATYMDMPLYMNENLTTKIRPVCLFEVEEDYPIARHVHDNYVAATKNVKFVIRPSATISNYDYTWSYEFYLDGGMEVHVRASGYIQGAYAGETTPDDYGYRVHNNLAGAPHEHVINMKADFDILGTNNSLQIAKLQAITKNYTWSDGSPRNTFHIQRSFVDNEDQGRMHWTASDATQFNIVNTDERNPFGEYRGYRIAASGPTAHLTPVNSTDLYNAAHPFEYDLSVSRQKDTEPKSCHQYNGMDIAAPMVNFNDFFNGESLRQEDLVLWFNLGLHHLPTSSDIPNTLFRIGHSSVSFAPVNYFDTDPTRETQNRVRADLNPQTGAVTNVELFGQDVGQCDVGQLLALGTA